MCSGTSNKGSSHRAMGLWSQVQDIIHVLGSASTCFRVLVSSSVCLKHTVSLEGTMLALGNDK